MTLSLVATYAGAMQPLGALLSSMSAAIPAPAVIDRQETSSRRANADATTAPVAMARVPTAGNGGAWRRFPGHLFLGADRLEEESWMPAADRRSPGALPWS